MAARSKFTAQTRSRIIEALQKGHYMESAAALAGVSRQAVYVWLERGRNAKQGRYREFYEAVENASAEAEDVLIGHIDTATADDWRAAAWKLERRHPDKWGKRERHEITGKGGEPIRIQLEWPSGVTPPSELS